jgi:hypothetical protein
VDVGGWAYGFQSHVAAVKILSNGEILVVERYGRIITLSPEGRETARKLPIYGGVHFSIPFAEVPNLNDPAWWKWGKFNIEGTAAAFIPGASESVYLVGGDNRFRVLKVPIDDFLKQPENDIVLEEGKWFHFADSKVAAWVRGDPPRFGVQNLSSGNDLTHYATALAVCSGWIIAGFADGMVVFFPETGDTRRDRRIRKSTKKAGEFDKILDLGCLSSDFAYSISEDARRQIMLWDLKTKSVIQEIEAGKGGHPGIAFVAIGARSGKHLVSLGDLDIRLWSVDNNALKLVAKYGRQMGPSSFAVAELRSGDFIVWDGVRVLRVPLEGGPLVHYAGPK